MIGHYHATVWKTSTSTVTSSKIYRRYYMRTFNEPVKKEIEYPCMVVTSMQIYPLKERVGKTVAFVRAMLNDQLQLTSLRIVKGANGLFVSYPNDPGYKGEDYRSLFYPLTAELREHIQERAIQEYQHHLARLEMGEEE